MAKTSSSSLQVQTEKELHIRHKRQLWRRQKTVSHCFYLSLPWHLVCSG